MSDRDQFLGVVQEWVVKGENDLKAAVQYATGARYPGWGEIPLVEARRAVAMALVSSLLA